MNTINRKLVIIFASTAIAVALALGLGYAFVFPYSSNHFRQIFATQVSAEVLAWKTRGSVQSEVASLVSSNTGFVCEEYRTNIPLAGVPRKILLSVSSSKFRGEGHILIEENGRPWWIGTNGNVQAVLSRKYSP